jgi:hypothetical protein
MARGKLWRGASCGGAVDDAMTEGQAVSLVTTHQMVGPNRYSSIIKCSPLKSTWRNSLFIILNSLFISF